MKKELLLLIVVTLLLSSCRTTSKTEVLPGPTGTLEGFTSLFDEFGNPLSNSAGISVKLDSTSYSYITDTNGRYVFVNIPVNRSYNFTFSKAGYPNWHSYDFQFLTQGNAPLLTKIGTNNNNGEVVLNLYPSSLTVVNSLTAVSNTGYIALTANLSNTNPTYKSSSPIGAVIFVSRQKNVSPNNYEYYLTTTPSVTAVGVFTTNFNGSNVYANGTTVYFVAYGYSGTSNAALASYINASNGSPVYPYLNENPSAVISSVTQ